MTIKVGDQVKLNAPNSAPVPGGRAGVSDDDIGIVERIYLDNYMSQKKVPWANIRWLTGELSKVVPYEGKLDALWTTTVDFLQVFPPSSNRQALYYLKE